MKKKGTAKAVAALTDEQAFFKRTLDMHNRTKTKNQILHYINTLQRLILTKRISKSSPNIGLIKYLEKTSIELFRSMRSPRKVVLKDDTMSRIKMVLERVKVRDSVRLIRRYLLLNGRMVTKAKVDELISAIDYALKRQWVTSSDPYYPQIMQIHRSLVAYRSKGRIDIHPRELRGLEGIAGMDDDDIGPLDGPMEGAHSYDDDDEEDGKVYSPEELMSRKVDKLEFDGKWSDFFGRPSRNFRMLMHGDPGGGKSFFLFQFAKYLLRFGRVIFVSSEELEDDTFVDKYRMVFGDRRPSGIDFAANLKKVDLDEYDFLIVDSVTDLGMKLVDYKALRAAHKHLATILILMNTKDGKFKGVKDWEHVVQISCMLTSHGILTTKKNRYTDVGLTMDVFEDLPITKRKS